MKCIMVDLSTTALAGKGECIVCLRVRMRSLIRVPVV